MRFGKGPNTALSTDSDCEPLAKVNVLISTLDKGYFASAPVCRVLLWATRYGGFGLTRLTNS
jgi:hypothetical protein